MPEGHPFNISVHELINTLVCIRPFGLILYSFASLSFLPEAHILIVWASLSRPCG